MRSWSDTHRDTLSKLSAAFRKFAHVFSHPLTRRDGKHCFPRATLSPLAGRGAGGEGLLKNVARIRYRNCEWWY